ncbi:MAG: T9SS type A sorting domain-containing protein [Ignavibacteria bacterium]|nr:T9SS type A sorting domain-containing protein [Ignavibacteria bacterium]
MTPGGAYVSGAHQNVVLTYMNWEIIYDYGGSIGQRIPGTIRKATDSIASIFNWLNANDPGVNLYLYECWPKIEKNYIMNGKDWSLSTGKAPSSAQWVNYLNYATGNSNGFWKDLQDSLIKKAGIVNTKLIPSSMICAKLWRQGGLLSDMPVDSIFEDLGPHGKPSSYFLTAMIVYSAQHKKSPVKPFASHPQIDQRILDRFSDISALIMTELNAFNFPNGESRVWENTTTKIEESKELGETNIKIYPNPVEGIINLNIDIKLFGNVYTIYDNIGRVVLTGIINQENTTIDLGNLSDGIYMFCIGSNVKQTFKIIKE